MVKVIPGIVWGICEKSQSPISSDIHLLQLTSIIISVISERSDQKQVPHGCACALSCIFPANSPNLPKNLDFAPNLFTRPLLPKNSPCVPRDLIFACLPDYRTLPETTYHLLTTQERRRPSSRHRVTQERRRPSSRHREHAAQ